MNSHSGLLECSKCHRAFRSMHDACPFCTRPARTHVMAATALLVAACNGNPFTNSSAESAQKKATEELLSPDPNAAAVASQSAEAERLLLMKERQRKEEERARYEAERARREAESAALRAEIAAKLEAMRASEAAQRLAAEEQAGRVRRVPVYGLPPPRVHAPAYGMPPRTPVIPEEFKVK